MPATNSADFLVIGSGIVGLTIARELVCRFPEVRVVVVEKERQLAEHASGRNSGVLHAGFYYSPDSLKATLTREGNQLLHEFCDEHNVVVRRCGKVVVTRNQAELPRLDDLARRGVANRVPLETVGERELAELEPLARTCERALFSPTTSVADPVAVVTAIARDFVDKGGELRLGTHVDAAAPGVVVTSGEVWSVGHVVNCAGLYADVVARGFGMCDDYLMLPFKGVYRYARWGPNRLRRLSWKHRKPVYAHGVVPVHKGVQPGAEQAYVQATLKGPTTWVLLPPEAWPEHWKG